MVVVLARSEVTSPAHLRCCPLRAEDNTSRALQSLETLRHETDAQFSTAIDTLEPFSFLNPFSHSPLRQPATAAASKGGL